MPSEHTAGGLPFAIGTETWGSVTCPAITCGATAFRPTFGAVPQQGQQGVMSLAPSLDKAGLFCRTALDCALLADVLAAPPAAVAAAGAEVAAGAQDGGASLLSSYFGQFVGPWELGAVNRPQQPLPAVGLRVAAMAGTPAAPAAELGGSSIPPPGTDRPHPAPAAASAAAAPASAPSPSPAGAAAAASALRVGYLQGSSEDVLSALAAAPGVSLLGPLQPFPRAALLADVLTVLVQSEAAWTLGSLNASGLLSHDSHWSDVIRSGLGVPAARYFNAQRLRRALLRLVRDFFQRRRVDVLLHPARVSGSVPGRASSDLATLLGLPQLVLPAGFSRAAVVAAGRDEGSTSGCGSCSTGARRPEGQGECPRLMPQAHSIIGLPGDDAAVLAVGVLFQERSCCHLVRPPAAGSCSKAPPTSQTG